MSPAYQSLEVILSSVFSRLAPLPTPLLPPSLEAAWGGVAGSVLSLTTGTALTLLVVRHRTARSECDKIKRRHGRFLVDGTAQPGWNPERRLILETFEDLRRIAEREAQLVVHEQRDDDCVYLVPLANGVTAEFWVSQRVDGHTMPSSGAAGR